MAIWPFNRKKKQDSDLPKEVQDYYQAEKRERVGVAGLLALATLVITVVLAMGLFFGGRWVYRTVFEKDETPTSEVAEQEPGEQEETGTSSTSTDNDNDETPAPAPTPTPTPSPAPSTPSPTGTTSDDLPNTGPAQTSLVALAVSILGGLGYWRFRRPQE